MRACDGDTGNHGIASCMERTDREYSDEYLRDETSISTGAFDDKTVTGDNHKHCYS